MTINGKRDFTFNGKKYHVMDCLKADVVDKKKYYIAYVIDGRYETAYNSLSWDVEKFETIKDAQRYVLNWDFLLARW